MIQENKRVLLGMSGGTDSSVAAMRLIEAGYEVTGVTFRFYEPDGATGYLDDARQLARQLGFRHITYDAREVFRRQVIDYFVEEYMAGRTPVPCTLCNNRLKWPLLAALADELGIYHIATGHYARTVRLGDLRCIAAAADPDKDQTFFLWGLGQDILRRMLLPMGDITKAEARAWAAERGFRRVATKKDSIGVCFCPGDYRGFLRRWMEEKAHSPSAGEQERQQAAAAYGKLRRGRFVDEEGRFIAWHDGYPFYTVGQRRGLGVQLNRPVFVKDIFPAENVIVLAPLASLEKGVMLLKEWNLIDESRVLGHADTIVKIRYRKQENHCTVTVTPDRLLHVRLHEPLTAVAAGQAAAFYKDGLLLGGGIIEQAY